MTAPNKVLRSRQLVICALCYAVILCLFISGSSLWTDEAFSAWLASQRSFDSFAASLLHSGTSDLQMALYYLYLFLWAKLFGAGEFALRAANIPFIFIFSFALVWSSWRVFRSRWVWLAPAMLPFVWHYASEARPYMALLAFSAAALASLLRFISADPSVTLKRYPWIFLSCIVMGSLFHMLFLLAVAPMVLILVPAWLSTRSDSRWHYWRFPLAAFALPFCGLAVFLAFTFQRGVLDYNYPAPGVRQMASLVYEFSGFSGFGPNRKFSLDFRHHAVPLALGGLAILTGVLAAAGSGLRRNDRTMTRLAVAAFLGGVEVPALCVLSGRQLDARHLAALVPLFLLLLMAVMRNASPRAYVASLALLSSAWLVADLRMEFMPEYQKEDYRDAVRAVLSIHRQTGAEIVVAADPVGAAYYGADVLGPAPCFPIQVACTPAFQTVAWPRSAPALDASRWSEARVQNWLRNRPEQQSAVAVLLRLDRNHRNNGWEPILAADQLDPHLRFQGFEIVVMKTPIHSGTQPALSVPASPASSPAVAAFVDPVERVHR